LAQRRSKWGRRVSLPATRSSPASTTTPAQIYNRERWQVGAVDAESQKVVLQGIDQARQVELNAGYLARTNPYNDAPALEHAYAVTTYSAQGTTVDRAFVMADPSMDKQEMYRAELEATERILAERRELAVTATRIAPPGYITKELGERPADPEKRRSWEAGVRTIEGYRQEHGVKGSEHAFGRDTGRSAERRP
jgi:hypothetical protein